MITHVVLFKLRERNPATVARIKKLLESLWDRVPQLKHIEVGVDLLGSQRSYDLALITKFDSLEDLEKYQRHPYHVEVADEIAKVRESAVAVDYES